MHFFKHSYEKCTNDIFFDTRFEVYHFFKLDRYCVCEKMFEVTSNKVKNTIPFESLTKSMTAHIIVFDICSEKLDSQI